MIYGNDQRIRSKEPFFRVAFPRCEGERFVIVRRERPLAALINAAELERLERSAEIMHRLARTFGQSAKLLKSIEGGKVFV